MRLQIDIDTSQPDDLRQLTALTEALNKIMGVPAPAEMPKAPEETPKEEKPKEETPNEEPVTDIPYSALLGALKLYAKSKGKPAAIEALKKLGAKTLSEVPPEKYQEAIDLFNGD